MAPRKPAGEHMEREKPKRGVFNTDEVLDLMARFEQSTLTEMRLRNGEVELLFRRGMAGPLPAAQPYHLHVPAGGPPPAQAAGPVAASAKPQAPSAPGLEAITSPIVGTFYRSPAPDAQAYIEKGARVKKGQTICILEAMKLMNELEAEFDCEIVEILVENGKMVEFGTPLFEVRRI
jgi:acetyl-CoA carboxylase biotin carboxyl carrier protein